MNTPIGTGESFTLSRERLKAFVGQIFGGAIVGREGDDNPLPPGPWDPIIRKVARAFTHVMLNPQPLPPRAAFLVAVTEEVVERALVIQDLFEAFDRASEERGIIIVGGRFSHYVDGIDELCPRIERRIPGPRPPRRTSFSGFELLAAAVVFQQNADDVAHEGLRQELQKAASRLFEAGLARL